MLRLRPQAALLFVFTLSGCEIIASFDRDKIPVPELRTPDASLGVPAPPQREAGVLPEGGLDAGFDAGLDASMDAGPADAGPNDAGDPDDAGDDAGS